MKQTYRHTWCKMQVLITSLANTEHASGIANTAISALNNSVHSNISVLISCIANSAKKGKRMGNSDKNRRSLREEAKLGRATLSITFFLVASSPQPAVWTKRFPQKFTLSSFTQLTLPFSHFLFSFKKEILHLCVSQLEKHLPLDNFCIQWNIFLLMCCVLRMRTCASIIIDKRLFAYKSLNEIGKPHGTRVPASIWSCPYTFLLYGSFTKELILLHYFCVSLPDYLHSAVLKIFLRECCDNSHASVQ